MGQNIFWDKKLTEKDAAKILAVESHERFLEIAALLLSRTNDIKLVLSRYLDKETFCRKWRKIKAEMRKNKWADERIDFWDQIYRTLYVQLGDKIRKEKKEKVSVVPDLMKFAEIFTNERKKQKMTQKTLAQKTGLTQQYISYIEQGKSDFSVTVLKKLSDALNLKVKISSPDSVIGTSFSFSDSHS